MPEAPLQRVRPAVTDRGVTLDGAGVRGSVWGWELGADPLAIGLDERRNFGGVDLVTGRYGWSTVSIALPAKMPWAVGFAYSGSSTPTETAPAGPVGRHWFQLERPELVRSFVDDASERSAGDVLYLIYGPDRFVEFRRRMGGSALFVGVNGAAGAIVEASDLNGRQFYEYRDPSGLVTTFFGFAGYSFVGADRVAAGGQLWKVADAAGNSAFVGHKDDIKAAAEVGLDALGRVVRAYDSSGRRFDYVYASGAGGQLERVTASMLDLAGTPTKVAEVRLRRVDVPGGTAEGSLGAMVGIEEEELFGTSTDWSTGTIVRTTRFRVAGDGSGLIRMVFEPEVVRRNGVAAISAGTDTELAKLASVALLHEASDLRRVSGVAFSGLATSFNGLWLPTHTIAYSAVASSTLAGNQAGGATTRAVIEEVKREGSASTPTRVMERYFDAYGQALTSVERSPTGTPRFVSVARRDASGSLELTASPEAVQAFDPNTGVATLKASDGVIRVIRRATTADGPWAERLVRGTTRQLGIGGSSVVWESWRALGSAEQTIADWPLPAQTHVLRRVVTQELREYVVETSAFDVPGQYTSRTWAYSWHPGTLIASKVVETQPVVPTSQNGSGIAQQTIAWYRLDGSIWAHQSEGDRLTAWQQDAHGNISKTVADASPSLPDPDPISGLPLVPADAVSSGSATNPALHRVTTFVRDVLGREVRRTLPDGRVEEITRARVPGLGGVNSELVTIAVPLVKSGLWSGPCEVTVFGHGGEILAEGVVTPGDRHEDAGNDPRAPGAIASSNQPPSTWINGGFAGGGYAGLFSGAADGPRWVSLSENFYSDDQSRLVQVREWTRLPTSGGTPTHLNSFMRYDGLGRLKDVSDPTGTVESVTYDIFGRVEETRTSILASVLSEPTKPLGLPMNWQISPTDSWTRSRSIYDDANGGRLLRIERNRTENAIVTESLGYDRWGRPVSLYRGAPPGVMVKLDNLGRVIESSLWEGNPVAAGGVGLKELARMEFMRDPFGRVFKQRQHLIDPLTGQPTSELCGGGWAGQPYRDTDTWFGKHGKVKMVRGETIEKTTHDRMCNVTATLTVASTNPNPTYATATTVTSEDRVVQENVYVRNQRNGGLRGVISADRHPGVGQQLGGGRLLGLFINYDPTGEPTIKVPASSPGRILMKFMRPDELERPRRIFDFGNAGIEENGTTGEIQYCMGISCPTITTINGVAAREQRLDYDERGALAVIVDETDRGTRRWFDDAGKLVKETSGWQHPLPTPLSSPEKFPIPPTHRDPAECVADDRWIEYDEFGRTKEERMFRWPDLDWQYLNPQSPEPPEPQILRKWYKNTFPSSFPPGYENRPKNNREPYMEDMFPLWRGMSGRVRFRLTDGLGAPEFLKFALTPAGPFTESIEFTTDVLGQVLSRREKLGNGCGEEYMSNYSRDPLGRVMEMSRTPMNCSAGDEPAIQRVRFRFDAAGGLCGVDQCMEPMSGVNPDGCDWQGVQFKNDIPATGGGWRNTRRSSLTLPGSASNSFDLVATNGSPMSEPGIDDAIGRTGRIILNGEERRMIAGYGYYGVSRPSWRDVPEIMAENPVYSPTRTFPGDNRITPWFKPGIPGLPYPPRRDPRPLEVDSPFKPLPGNATPSRSPGITNWNEVDNDWWRQRPGPSTVSPNFDVPNPDDERFITPMWMPGPTPPPLNTPPANPQVGPEVHPWHANERGRPIIWVDYQYGTGTETGKIIGEYQPWETHDEILSWLPGVAPNVGDDRRFGYDCKGGIEWMSSGYMPAASETATAGPRTIAGTTNWSVSQALGSSNQGAPGSPVAFGQAPSNRLESFLRDPVGNIRSQSEFRPPATPPVTTGGQQAPPVHDLFTREYDGANRVAEQARSRANDPNGSVGGAGGPLPPLDPPIHDSRGNLIDDGDRWLYKYDLLGQLVEVRARNAPSGHVFAKFTYNALGWRTSAAYDLNGNGSVLDDPRELYTYDEQWRVVAIHRQGPATTSPPPAGQPEAILARPLPQLYQRFVYHQDGLPAQGVSTGVIDRVVLRQRDADDNPDTGPDGLEETLYYIQNSRGDVMQVIRPIAGPSDEWWNDDRGGYAVESVRYSLYGVPTAIASADINRDGVVDERDVSLFVNGWVQGEIDRRLDVNNNGRLETGPPIDPA
ncbi:MAG: hypothetical protein ACK5WB_02580, partial [Phycisphaerales bacterium]